MGLLFFALARDRRRVVAKNLELCFPKLLPRERARLRLKHFMSLGRAIADCSIVWWSKASSIKKLAKIEGKTPVIALCEKNRPGFWVMVHSSDLEKLKDIKIDEE